MVPHVVCLVLYHFVSIIVFSHTGQAKIVVVLYIKFLFLCVSKIGIGVIAFFF